VKDITDAGVKTFKLGADAALVQVSRSSKENKRKGGVLFSER
jgi:hypothetical protein